MKTELQQIREALGLAYGRAEVLDENYMDEYSKALEALTTLEQEYVTDVDLIKWLALPHDVSISTKQRSDYWANQFKVAHEQAVKLIADAMEDE